MGVRLKGGAFRVPRFGSERFSGMQNFLSSRNETQKRFFHKHKNAQKYFVRFEVFYSRYGNRETQRAHGTAKKSQEPRQKSQDKRQLNTEHRTRNSLTSLLNIEQAILHHFLFSGQNRGFLIIRGLRERYRLFRYTEYHLFVQRM